MKKNIVTLSVASVVFIFSTTALSLRGNDSSAASPRSTSTEGEAAMAEPTPTPKPPKDTSPVQPVVIDTPPLAPDIAEVPVAVPAPPRQVIGYAQRMVEAYRSLEAGNPVAAAADFSAASTLEPQLADPLIGLTKSYIAQNAPAKAAETLSAVLLLDATHPEASYLRGQIAKQQGQYAVSLEFFTEAADAGVYPRGVLAAFLDRPDEAKELLSSVATQGEHAKHANAILAAYTEFSLFPDGTKKHLDTLLSRAFISAGEYQLAMEKARSVTTADPTYRDAWKLFGFAALALADNTSAISAFSSASTLDPLDPEAAYLLGHALLTESRYGEALPAFEQASQHGYAHPLTLARDMHAALLGLGRSADAAAFLESALDDTAALPDFSAATDAYLQVDDGASAWRVASAALSRYEDSAAAHALAGKVSLKNGYIKEAGQQLHTALSMEPTLASVHALLGEYFETLQQTDRALDAYNKAFTLDPEGHIGRAAAQRYNELLDVSL